MNRMTIALLAALALAGVAFAQDKQLPPEGGTPKNFELPNKTSFALDNGLQVTLVPFGDIPKVTVRLVVRSGNINEGGNTWLADLSGDFLLEGTSSRSADDIAREAASMGGAVTVGVGEDLTTINGEALSEFAPAMAKLVADVAMNPSFPEAELERLKRDRLRQLSVARTQPQQMATAAFRKAMYPDHPYGNPFPTDEQLSAYTIDDAKSFYAENFGAQRSHVYVAGKFDTAAVRAAIESAFGEWKRGPDVFTNVPTPVDGKVVVDVVDRPGAVQSNLYLGIPVVAPGEEDYIAMQISNTLLGGFFSSRITRNIREDKGYTYSPFSMLSTRYKDAYWAQVAAVTTNVTGPAMQEIMKEIDELQKTPPSEDELQGVKNYASGVFVLQNSTRGGIIAQLSNLDLHELPDEYLTNWVSKVHALTPEQISATVAKYLRQEDMTLVVVGDRSQISEQVADYMEKPE
jgi:zinc protease